MIYAKEGLRYKHRDDLKPRGIENIWIEVANRNKQIRLHCFKGHQIQMRVFLMILKIQFH